MDASPRTFRNTLLALSLAAAFAGSAHAAITATALPAGGAVAGPATISSSGNALQISVGGNAVINWAGGFNIGSAASVTVNGTASGSIPALLNVDTSGHPSELAGTLTANNASVFIANQNGVIVDGTANLSAPQGTMGLIAAPVDASAFTSSGSFTIKGGAPTQLTLNDGATINDSRLLLAGVGAVNIGNVTNSSSMSANLYVGEGTDPTNMQVVTPNATNGGFNADTSSKGIVKGTPTTVTLNAGATLNGVGNFVNFSDGANTINGTVTATPQLYGEPFGGWLYYQGGDLTGSGTILANRIVYSGWGNWNNVTSASNYLLNGFHVAPLNASGGAISGPSVIINLQETGRGNQHINIDGGNSDVILFGSPQQPGYTQYIGANMGNLSGFVPNGGDGLIVQGGDVEIGIINGDTAFAFPGSIALMAKDKILIYGNINNAWSGSGRAFQGMFFEAPVIDPTTYAPIVMQTNGNNWVNFSNKPGFMPATLALGANGLMQNVAGLVHQNSYSTEIQAAAAGQNWTSLVNFRPINQLSDFDLPPVHQP